MAKTCVYYAIGLTVGKDAITTQTEHSKDKRAKANMGRNMAPKCSKRTVKKEEGMSGTGKKKGNRMESR